MPYSIRKQKNKYAIVNKQTGQTVAHSPSKAGAKRVVQVRNAIDHGWKPKN